MTTSANNICAGPGHIFLAPVGTTLPTASDVASLLAGTLTDWTSLGETKTGITQVVTESYLDIRTQQRTHQVAKVKTGQKTEFKTQLLEISASAIAAMSNGTVATASDADTVTPGGLGATNVYSLAIVGPGVGTTYSSILVIADHVTYSASQSLAFDATAEAVLDVTFDVLASDNLPLDYATILVKPSI